MENYIKSQIIPQYKSFDAAHREDHVYIVISESLRLAAFYDVDIAMVYAIAAYHDLGLINGRDNHHIDSGKILLADNNLRNWFNEEQLLIMKEAVEDHRASDDKEPRSIYGKIVAEADRDIEPLRILKRTVQFGAKHYPQMSKEEAYERFYTHLQEKYAEDGYLKLWLPQSANAEKLSQLREMIKDERQLKGYFEEYYEPTVSEL